MTTTTEVEQTSPTDSSEPDNHHAQDEEEEIDLGMPEPPHCCWGWTVVSSSFMIHAIADGVMCSFGIFYMEFLKHFGGSKGAASWVATIMVVMTFCVGPFASGLTNQFGCRTVTIIGSLLAAFGLAISTIAPNITFLYFSIGICTGTGFGLMYFSAIVCVTCYFEKKRAFATGLAMCGSGFGTFSLPLITEWLVTKLGWQKAMLVTASFVLDCCIFGALFRPLEKKPTTRRIPTCSFSNLTTNRDTRQGSLQNGTIGNNSDVQVEDDVQIEDDDGKELSKPSTTKRIINYMCPPVMQDSFKEMMNFQLMRNVIFLMFVFSNFFTNIGFNVPFGYTHARAIGLGLADEGYVSLLSVISVASTIGRVILGYLSDCSCINRLWLYNASLALCGFATAFSSFCLNYGLMALYAAVFGATAGAYVSLTSVILVDLLGLDKLTNAFGLLLFFEGMACLIGPPITDWLHDYTGSYDPGFYVSGGMIAFSGLMLFFIPCVQRSVEKDVKEKSQQMTEIKLSPTLSSTAAPDSPLKEEV